MLSFQHSHHCLCADPPDAPKAQLLQLSTLSHAEQHRIVELPAAVEQQRPQRYLVVRDESLHVLRLDKVAVAQVQVHELGQPGQRATREKLAAGRIQTLKPRSTGLQKGIQAYIIEERHPLNLQMFRCGSQHRSSCNRILGPEVARIRKSEHFHLQPTQELHQEGPSKHSSVCVPL